MQGGLVRLVQVVCRSLRLEQKTFARQEKCPLWPDFPAQRHFFPAAAARMLPFWPAEEGTFARGAFFFLSKTS